MQSADLAAKQGTLADAKKLLQTVAELRTQARRQEGRRRDQHPRSARSIPRTSRRACAPPGPPSTWATRRPRCASSATSPPGSRSRDSPPRRSRCGRPRSISISRTKRPRAAAGGLPGGRRAGHGAEGGARRRRAQADRAAPREQRARPTRCWTILGEVADARSGRPRSARRPRAGLRVARRPREGAHLPVGGNRRRQRRAVADAGRNRIARRPQRRRPGAPSSRRSQLDREPGAERGRGRLPAGRIESGGGLSMHRRRGRSRRWPKATTPRRPWPCTSSRSACRPTSWR